MGARPCASKCGAEPPTWRSRHALSPEAGMATPSRFGIPTAIEFFRPASPAKARPSSRRAVQEAIEMRSQRLFWGLALLTVLMAAPLHATDKKKTKKPPEPSALD